MRHPFGMLEPNPLICERISQQNIDLILVPGLAFDKKNHRLGCGKGFYDRYLCTIPSICTWGIGFKEQLVAHLPLFQHDISLWSLRLF